MSAFVEQAALVCHDEELPNWGMHAACMWVKASNSIKYIFGACTVLRAGYQSWCQIAPSGYCHKY